MTSCFWGSETVDPARRAGNTVSSDETIAFYRHNTMLKDNAKLSTRINQDIVKPKPYKGSGYRVSSEHAAKCTESLESYFPTSEMNDQGTLHAVLAVLIQIIRRETVPKSSAEANKNLFQAPKQRMTEKYYTAEIEKEHMDYFISQRNKAEQELNRGKRGTWLRRMHVTPVNDLRYSFDRHANYALQYQKLKKTKTLSKADDAAANANATGNWSKMQTKHLDHRQKQFEHMIAIIEEQQVAEVHREIKALSLKVIPGQPHTEAHYKKVMNEIAIERAKCADWIMHILDEYEVVSSAEKVVYLRETVKGMQRRYREEQIASRGSGRTSTKSAAASPYRAKQKPKKKKHHPIPAQMLSTLTSDTTNRSYSTVIYNPLSKLM